MNILFINIFPGSAIPILTLYLLSYEILFPIPILHSLPDPFPITIQILNFLSDPDQDPAGYHDIIYIFN